MAKDRIRRLLYDLDFICRYAPECNIAGNPAERSLSKSSAI